MINEKLEEVLTQELYRHEKILEGASAVSDGLVREVARSFTFREAILDEPAKLVLRYASLTGYAYDFSGSKRAELDYQCDLNELRLKSLKRRTKPKLFGEGIRDNVGWYIEITG